MKKNTQTPPAAPPSEPMGIIEMTGCLNCPFNVRVSGKEEDGHMCSLMKTPISKDWAPTWIYQDCPVVKFTQIVVRRNVGE